MIIYLVCGFCLCTCCNPVSESGKLTDTNINCPCKDGYYCNPPIVTLNIMYDLHNVINLSVDVSHVLILRYLLVNNKICLKQSLLRIQL